MREQKGNTGSVIAVVPDLIYLDLMSHRGELELYLANSLFTELMFLFKCQAKKETDYFY